VLGHTCTQTLIDVTNIPDLTATSSAATGLTVGAAVSLKQLIELCREQDPLSPLFTNDPSTETVRTASSSFAALARHVLRVANQQVRSVGSWAGNFMLATHHQDFPSDVVLVRGCDSSDDCGC
jgi:CO/xanthine dehydrogenase FAD-binding subunit